MPPDTATTTPGAATTAAPAPAQPAGAPTATPSSGAPPAPAQTARQAERARMRDVARQVLGKAHPTPSAPAGAPSGGAPASQVVSDAPTAQAAATAAQIEAAGGDAPAQRQGESDKSYELRLSRALTDLARAQGEAATHRKRGDVAEARATQLEAQAKELQAIVDGARGNVERALELAGVTPDEVAQMMLEGKLKRGKYAHLPPEVRQRLEQLERKEAEREKADREAREAQEREAQDRANREADLALVTEQLGTLGAQYVLPATMPRATERLLDALYAEMAETKKQPDIAKTMERLQGHITEDVTALLSNEAAAKLLCSNPAVRDTLRKVLGVPAREQSPQSPTSDDAGKQTTGDGPRSLPTHVASEVPGRRPAPISERERQERIRAAGRQVLRGA